MMGELLRQTERENPSNMQRREKQIYFRNVFADYYIDAGKALMGKQN